MDSAADGEGAASPEAVHLRKLSQNMFGKIGSYVQSELQVTTEDYKLLQQMNDKTKEKCVSTKMRIALHVPFHMPCFLHFIEHSLLFFVLISTHILMHPTTK